MTTDLFIKTFPKDYPWLPWCLRSVEKFATGFRRVVIVTEEDKENRDQGPAIMPHLRQSGLDPAKICLIVGWPQVGDDEAYRAAGRMSYGYEAQKATKLMWQTFTDAQMVVHIDSDMLFTAPVTPQTFMDGEGRPYWVVRDWETVPEDHRKAWEPGAAWFAEGYPLHVDGMTRPGFIFTRQATNAFAMDLRRRGIEDPMELFTSFKYPQASEYCLFGNFLKLFWERYTEVPHFGYAIVEEGTIPSFPIAQFWSWNPRGVEAYRAEIDRILEG